MISIINYGLGNLGSVQNMIRKLGAEASIITSPEQLKDASKVILPGVGAFDTGITHLVENGWMEPLSRKVLYEKVPTLGICLGMQLMTQSSEEGNLPGLGWIRGHTRRFTFPGSGLKIPHMGWNKTNVVKPSSVLSQDGQERRFYYVHSYYVDLANPEDRLLSTLYGHEFTSGFERENIIGVQFHPEKSHKFGMELFRNFISNFR